MNRLLAEAVARHGVKLDSDDPAMVIVTLNRLMLEDAVRGVADEIREAVKEFDAAGERIQKAVGTTLARELSRAARGGTPVVVVGQWIWIALSVAVAFFVGLIVGRSI
ncbi:hypothetical protein [Bryobacter aggregatus]|uniref:hypothetical protein n=1 Tax=Bryobacter aggregatus TaxID=360054 RepID=UPI0012BAC019|nr:hypothetical protein [Bryobacter aggregatus]